jgi:hypothetical protein
MALQTANPQRTLAADAALEERLEHFVQQRTSGMVQHLRVRVHQAEVVLTGLARNYYTKQLATHAVLDEIRDVMLTNDIEVV